MVSLRLHPLSTGRDSAEVYAAVFVKLKYRNVEQLLI